MRFHESKVSFASGELTPLLAGRADLAAYATGAKEIVNGIVLSQGVLINRPGTTQISSSDYTRGGRLVPFIYNETDSCMLVFYHVVDAGCTVDIWRGSALLHTFTGPVYSAAAVQGMRWLQSADILYLFYQGYPPYKLSRYSDTNWVVEQVSFQNGPFMATNSDSSSLAAYRVAGYLRLSGSVSSAKIFVPSDVGRLFRLEFKVPATSDSLTLEASAGTPAVSEEFILYGAATIESRGIWTGTVEVQRKTIEDDTFETVRTYVSADDYNFGFSASVEQDGTRYRLRYSRDSGSGSVGLSWSSAGGLTQRVYLMTSYGGSHSMFATPVEAALTGATPNTSAWAKGAFGPGQGYPALGIFHQERLVLANTTADPQTIWMSKSASWEDFGTSIPAEDTDAITVTLAAKEVNEIRGLSSRSDLLVFTSGAEWVGSAGSKSDVFTPSNISFTPSGYHGSANVAPVEIGSSTLFAQTHGRVVRGIGYSLEIDGYSASEISILSNHLFESSGVSRWAYQQEPWSVLWVVLGDGSVLTLTMQQEHQVTAWTRQVFPWPVSDIAVIPGDTQDDVYILFNTGASRRRLSLLNRRADVAGQYNDATYQDHGVGYSTTFESLELEQPGAGGSIQGRHKHVPDVTLRLFRTCGARAGIVTENSGDVDLITFPDSTAPGYRSTPYTGDVYIQGAQGGAGRTCRVRVVNDQPRPFTLLSIYQGVEMPDG